MSLICFLLKYLLCNTRPAFKHINFVAETRNNVINANISNITKSRFEMYIVAHELTHNRYHTAVDVKSTISMPMPFRIGHTDYCVI